MVSYSCYITNFKSKMISRRRGLRRRGVLISTLRCRRRANDDSALIWNWNKVSMRENRLTILVGSCLAISLAGHMLILSACAKLRPLDFGMPVSVIDLIDVGLKTPRSPDASASARKPDSTYTPQNKPSFTQKPHTASQTEHLLSIPVAPETINTVDAPASAPEKTNLDVFALDPPLRSTEEFLRTSHEKLVYQISMLGLPVGSAELDAFHEKGEFGITLKVKSDAGLSTIYPVDDLIETRHINGNFILTRIRQQEGNFRGDRGFTLFLRDKSVFWIDRLANSSLKEPLPNSDVLDILSGLYFLRNRPMQVGTAETLHIYDSDNYAAVPVNVIRRETIRLPAFREVNTLLVQPEMKTGGIFKRTGDVHIWFSDDQYKVPVKIVTSIAMGQITVELVSAVSRHPGSQVQ